MLIITRLAALLGRSFVESSDRRRESTGLRMSSWRQDTWTKFGGVFSYRTSFGTAASNCFSLSTVDEETIS